MLIKNNSENLVSVILPVYNAEKYIINSVESILSQSYSNFELLILNDGSTDATSDLLKKFQTNRNVKIIERENKGIVATLNEGILISEGEYIMRMDADDISLPRRIEMQLNFLKQNNLDIIGSAVKTFGNKVNFTRNYFENDQKLKFQLLFATCFAHPTVFCRKEPLLLNPYSAEFEKIEDYELWTRLSLLGYKFGNLNTTLLKYRVHNSQITSENRNYQDEKRKEIAVKYSKHYLQTDKFTIAIQLLLNRNFKQFSETDSNILLDYYQYLKEGHLLYSDIINNHFFLCFMHNFFPQKKFLDFFEGIPKHKQQLLLAFNKGNYSKRIPIKIYRSLF